MNKTAIKLKPFFFATSLSVCVGLSLLLLIVIVDYFKTGELEIARSFTENTMTLATLAIVCFCSGLVTKYRNTHVASQRVKEQKKNWYRFKSTLLAVLSAVLMNTVARYENEFGHSLVTFTITDFITWFMIENIGFIVIFPIFFWYLSGKYWEEDNHQ
ncbi:hypothetical protein [Pseudoalteromonas sp. T1lg23B]|uniref:hypothetical protein n=1 Tax=Pseudoalteromonas sp. T1lg23B TaxID=2077097 RepID=UPI000CF66C29|nr:hypothetical protein [Pseudoalteromonas sp. T1lg23B]